MSDVEFVNVYMGKLKDHLNDQLTKIIMLETHLEIAGNNIKGLQEEIKVEQNNNEALAKSKEDLMDQLDDAKKEIKTLTSSLEEATNISNVLYADKEALKINIADLNAEIDRLRKFELNKGEVDALKSQLNTVQNELESARKREETMIADYQELSAKYSKLIEVTPKPPVVIKPKTK